ncbi:putative pentatricopeptide repeat-containing protein At3g47840 isoform X5 [Wolffia australiana]
MLRWSTSKAVKNVVDVGKVHQQAAKLGLLEDIKVGTHLLSLYWKCGCSDSVCRLFNDLPNHNTVTYTILITSFSSSGRYSMALEAFARMLNDGSLPNCVTLSSVFKSCAGLRALKHGKILHGWILRSGIESDTIMINSMVDLYAKCGELYSANKVFDSMSDRDHTSWNIMIEAHLQSGEIQRSLDFFQRLPSRDVVSWNTVINGLIRSGCLKIALQFLYQMAEKGARLIFSVSFQFYQMSMKDIHFNMVDDNDQNNRHNSQPSMSTSTILETGESHCQQQWH